MWLTYLFLCIVLAALLLTIYAAISDYKSLKIPNWISVGLLLLYPAVVLTSPTEVDWFYGLIVGGAVFVVGFCIFALGGLGGGDVKLLVALSVWSGLGLLIPFLLSVVITGGLLVIFILIREGRNNPKGNGTLLGNMRSAMRSRTPVPYGVAIGFGSVVIFYHYATQTSLFG